MRGAEESDLFAFLGEDGAEKWHQWRLIARVGGESGLGFGKRAEDYVGECLGQSDGGGEGADGELVAAGGDGGVVGGCEDAVYAEGVQFFLLEWEGGVSGWKRGGEGGGCVVRTFTMAVRVSTTYGFSSGA